MTSNFRYSLAKKGKHFCPACQKKTFVLYLDNETENIVYPTVGKCDRADNCGHHYTPKEYFQDNGIEPDTKTIYVPQPKAQPEPTFIEPGIFKKSLSRYENNNLVKYLIALFGYEKANEAVERYFVGSSKYWEGSTVFWQIDTQGRIRTGKIMQYDEQTGKRVKEPVNKISWVHAVLDIPDFTLSQCLFGEHLLKDNKNTVAIVESEKTAIIASIYLPEYIWIATGGCANLSSRKCKQLLERNVILYPDLGQFEKWKEKETELSRICNVSTSEVLETTATPEERRSGLDIADYLVRAKYDELEAHEKFYRKAEKKETDRTPDSSDTVAQEETTHADSLKKAFINRNGRLYIPTLAPLGYSTVYAVYSSVAAYNGRNERPEFTEADITQMREIFINLNTLKI